MPLFERLTKRNRYNISLSLSRSFIGTADIYEMLSAMDRPERPCFRASDFGFVVCSRGGRDGEVAALISSSQRVAKVWIAAQLTLQFDPAVNRTVTTSSRPIHD